MSGSVGKITDFTIRKPVLQNVPIIAEIVNFHAQKGLMLQRPISRIYDNIRDYRIVEVNDEIVGCGSLHIMWSDLAEIRSIALKEDYIGRGLGRPLVESFIDEAKTLGVVKVFVLTYQNTFFEHLGFSLIDKADLPHKIWSDCVNCLHFPNCDEIAMIKYLK